MPNENRKDLCGLTFNWLGTPRGMLWLIYRVYTQDATQDDLGRHVNMSGSTSLNRRRCRSLFLSTTGLFKHRGCFCSHHYTLCNPFNQRARLEAEIAKPLIDTFMWQGFLVFRFRYFQKSKLMAEITKFPGWMSLERVTLTEKKLKQVMFVQDVHHSPVSPSWLLLICCILLSTWLVFSRHEEGWMDRGGDSRRSTWDGHNLRKSPTSWGSGLGRFHGCSR